MESAVAWATPRLETAWRESVRAAAPQVEKAAGKATPAIDTAHDKIVDEFLPRVVALVNEAADRATGATKASEAAAAAAAKAAGGKKHRGAKVFWLLTLLAGAGAGLAAWQRNRNATDPWADPWEPASATPGSSTDQRADRTGGAAEAVGEAAGAGLARTREATKKAAERVADVRGDLTEKVGEAREAATKLASRRRASGESDEGSGVDEASTPVTASPEFGADTGDTLSSTTETVATDVPSGTPDDDAPSDGAKNSAGQWGSGQSSTS
ncbi:hypothetical protein [Cellulomonas sp. ATA003]|uniref:hypothetical protein n=1 Tax=Cellulomonas sp. ATA003 TaxID=3073064 RepID=UPI002872D770|nr:hypothetical protein [Cellulomonas sp. ATA003]WNB85580.1 hypothetical protein REH70_18945 [Cellulomonas sp. ATA003]